MAYENCEYEDSWCYLIFGNFNLRTLKRLLYWLLPEAAESGGAFIMYEEFLNFYSLLNIIRILE